jgi:PAS domain S-box-containing protein
MAESRELLEQSEQRFNTLVANIPGAVYRCTYKGQAQAPPLRTMVFLSKAIEDISGYPPSDFINNRVRSFESIVHPQDRERVEGAVWQSLRAKQSYVVEYRIVRADGCIRWVYEKGQGIFSNRGEEQPQGLPLHSDGVILDITERKQAEADLRYTQAFLNSVVESLPVGVLIKDAEELRVMYWNKASEELFGYSREEVLGKNDYDFLPREQARYLRAKDRQILAGGVLVDIPEAPVMTPHQGQRIVQTKKVPLFDEIGTPRYLLGICEDITERKQAEAALRESEAHYRRILETASEGIWMFDADSKTTFANTRIAEMLGYSVEEMLGRSLFDFIHEESQAIAATYVERRRQGIHERHDFKFRRKDGSDLWTMVSATPIQDTTSQFVGVLRMITDISDRKRAEEQLQERAQFLHSIYDGVEDSIFVVDVIENDEGRSIEDEAENSLQSSSLTSHASIEFRYRGLNPAHERLTGVRSDELRGKRPEDVFPPAVATAVNERYAECVQSGTKISYEGCLPFQGKNTWWITTLFPLRDGRGHIYRLVGTSTNITERKEAEKALRESEQRFRATFAQAAVGIAHVDLDGKFLRINQKFCDLVGYSQEEMLARTLQNITHPDDLEADVAFVRQLLSGGIRMYSLEKRYINRCGEIVWVNLTVSLRRRSSGEPKYFISVVQDISDRKQTEVALQQSESQLRVKNQELQHTLHQLKQTQAQLIQNEKMVGLGRTIAGIAHEINNPIGFIYGNITHARDYASDLLHLVQLYAQHYPEPIPEIQRQIEALDLNFVAEDFPKLLKSMEMGANRIREIVLSLRNFSRLDEADAKKVDIHEGIDNTLLILQYRLTRQPFRSEIQVIEDYGQLPLVECYPSKLNQVFMNLLNNAIDALETHSTPGIITIRTETRQEERGNVSRHFIVIRIADNGPGIPEDVKKHIFDPFFTTKPIGAGMGLGLSISHSIIVEKHGGQLWCISEPDCGTEFVIELPVR